MAGGCLVRSRMLGAASHELLHDLLCFMKITNLDNTVSQCCSQGRKNEQTTGYEMAGKNTEKIVLVFARLSSAGQNNNYHF